MSHLKQKVCKHQSDPSREREFVNLKLPAESVETRGHSPSSSWLEQGHAPAHDATTHFCSCLDLPEALYKTVPTMLLPCNQFSKVLVAKDKVIRPRPTQRIITLFLCRTEDHGCSERMKFDSLIPFLHFGFSLARTRLKEMVGRTVLWFMQLWLSHCKCWVQGKVPHRSPSPSPLSRQLQFHGSTLDSKGLSGTNGFRELLQLILLEIFESQFFVVTCNFHGFRDDVSVERRGKAKGNALFWLCRFSGLHVQEQS